MPLGSSGPPVDSDLDDLLSSTSPPPTKAPPPHAFTATSTSSYATRHQSYYSSHSHGHSHEGPLGTISTLCWIAFQSCPRLGWSLTLLLLSSALYGLLYLLDPTEEVAVMPHDWTTVQSAYDLKVGDIDHWCLHGDDDSCRCEDPLVPTDRAEYRSWVRAQKDNQKMVRRYVDSWAQSAGGADVAFLGESLIEEMDGRWLGKTDGSHLENLGKIYQKHFSKSFGAPLEGVPLGIAGDTAPNVLWRLMHGEMPEGFDPPIWWVSLGMNDLARMQCSEEVVIMGILRVVEEIRTKRPDAKIVVNSLLPMHDMRSGAFPLANDYKDAFRPSVGRRRFGPFRGKPNKETMDKLDASHYARKRIQGEPEEDGDGGGRRRHRRRRLRDTSKPSTKKKNVNFRGRRKDSNLTPRQKAALEKAQNHANAVENMRKRKAFMEKQLRNRLKKDRVNPILVNKNKIKRFDPKRLFTKRTEVPLWSAITVINKNLRLFCEKHQHVTFFDATDIFAEPSGRNTYILKSDMISVRGHPTEAGFKAWEDAVASKLQYMLKDRPVVPTGPQIPLRPSEEDEGAEAEATEDISASEISGDTSSDESEIEKSKDTTTMGKEDESSTSTDVEDDSISKEDDDKGSGSEDEGNESNSNEDEDSPSDEEQPEEFDSESKSEISKDDSTDDTKDDGKTSISNEDEDTEESQDADNSEESIDDKKETKTVVTKESPATKSSTNDDDEVDSEEDEEAEEAENGKTKSSTAGTSIKDIDEKETTKHKASEKKAKEPVTKKTVVSIKDVDKEETSKKKKATKTVVSAADKKEKEDAQKKTTPKKKAD